MVSISWESVRSLVIFVGPLLLPKAISYYRSIRSNARSNSLAILPISTRLGTCLFLLAFLSLYHLFLTLPPFLPEDVFTLTDSRLQIPVDVLFNRVAALRPDKTLTPRDQSLRAKFVNMESRLLYLAVGPDVLADCPFCNADDATYYLLHGIPSVLAQHLLNACAIALSTSTSFTGRAGSQWRTLFTVAGIVLAGADVYLGYTVEYQSNARSLRLSDVTFHYWTLLTLRHVALAGLNAGLAFLLYLSCTNRAFGVPPTALSRIDSLGRALAPLKGKLGALGIIKNTTYRDEELRGKGVAYWNHEVRLMGEVMEEREVLDGVKDALENRIDISVVERDAGQYAEGIVSTLRDD